MHDSFYGSYIMIIYSANTFGNFFASSKIANWPFFFLKYVYFFKRQIHLKKSTGKHFQSLFALKMLMLNENVYKIE